MDLGPWTSATRRSRRRGVSILEVMFAILVATVGLLGAVAVFPVASSMARKGRINDQAAVAGRSAFHDFDARAMRQPARWLGVPANWNFPNVPNSVNRYLPVQNINWLPGSAFCIDPRLIAQATTANAAQMSLFPAVQRQAINNAPGVHMHSVDPRMFRITLASGLKDASGNLLPMQQLQADSIFTFEDDLSYDRPDEDRSLPATQLPNTGPVLWTASKRETEGHFSWMATLVPKVTMVQQFLPGGGGVYMAGQPTDEYVLSIVVFHGRTFDDERFVYGEFVDGITGGEIKLTTPNAADSAELLKLRSNDWLLVAGVHNYTVPGNSQPRLSNVPAFQWYRVTDCDDVEQTTGAPAQRYATLIGQDWPMHATNPRLGPGFNGHVQVTIVENVVAVYEKSVRLEY